MKDSKELYVNAKYGIKKKNNPKKTLTLLWDHYYSCSYGNRLFVLYASSYIFQELEYWKKGGGSGETHVTINSFQGQAHIKILDPLSKKENTSM